MTANERSDMRDAHEVFDTIRENPGLRWKQIAAMLDIPGRRVEDAIWDLWRDGKIQMENDSTLRVTRKGEKVFRHFT
jgi:Mn-dependent DtxR family transcriptional regulator